MAKHNLKILQCEHCKIFEVCLATLQYYAWSVNMGHFGGLFYQRNFIKFFQRGKITAFISF